MTEKVTKKINKGGRPTKYSEDKIEKVFEFIELKKGLNVPPFIEGLAYTLGVDCDTITNWCTKHKRFFRAIKRLKEVQRVMLQEHILGNNAAGGIFLLKNNHGFKDRTETDVTSGGKPIPLLGGQSVIHPDNSNGKDTPANQKN